MIQQNAYCSTILFQYYINFTLAKYEYDVNNELDEFVKNHTEITVEHLTPEIKLYLNSPRFPPYLNPNGCVSILHWRNYYPGEQAVARYILDNVHIVKNLSILEIGCGCGAASIAAAMSNAREVTANDIDPIAVAATKANAYLNNVHTLKFNEHNLVGTDITQDVVILSEVFGPTNSFDIYNWIDKLIKNGKTVLLGDTEQWLNYYNHREFRTQLAKYELPYKPSYIHPDVDISFHGVVYTLPVIN